MSHQWYCQCGYYNITYTTPIYVRAVAPSSAQPGTNCDSYHRRLSQIS
jgi:hypothetical protein